VRLVSMRLILRARTRELGALHGSEIITINLTQRAWYAAFDVQPGQALYLPDDQRVEIW
jgi:hypothetical protein